MHPFAQYQLLKLALSFAQHLKLIDSLHVWQQIRQTILLLVKNPVKTRLIVPPACCDGGTLGCAHVEWLISPCFNLNFLEGLSQLSIPATSLVKCGWALPDYKLLPSDWLNEKTQTWEVLTVSFPDMIPQLCKYFRSG